MRIPFFVSKAIACLLFAVPLSLMSASVTAEDTRPNILFILMDDMGKEWVSEYGSESVKTPNIDRLAATGMRFDNVYSHPQCTPSRMSLLTGQYPYSNGWVNHWDSPRWGHGYYDWRQNPSLARTLKQAGYATAAAGKWQVNDFRVEPEAMVKHGFDEYVMWTGYEEGNKASAERYWNPYLHTKHGSKTYPGKFSEDIFSDFLLDFTERHKDQPWFAYYPMALPHGPYVSTPLEPNVKTKHEKYAAMIRYADHLLAKMLRGLEAQGQRDNTIVIWTTDNGSARNLTGIRNGRSVRGAKTETIEAGVNMPFIVNAPGMTPAGVVSDALVDFTDMMPTFAELAETKLPEGYVFDGYSFASVIQGRAEQSPRDWILAMGGRNRAQVSAHGVENEFVFRDRVVRDQRFKLYFKASPERGLEKLIDLSNDPDEKHNLLASNDPEIKAALQRLLQAAARFPERDNDPRYQVRAAQPWDRDITVKSQEWKK